MSKFGKAGMRAAGVTAFAAASVLAVGVIGSGEAAAAKLPSGSKTSYGVDGEKITLKRTAERGGAVPTVIANFGYSRSAFVSGTVTATVPKDTEGTVTTGYIVGCQINVSGLSFGGGINFPLSLTDPIALLPSVTANVSVPLVPGEANFVAIGSASVKDGKAVIQYSQSQIDLQGCAGWAQARAATVIQTLGDFQVKSTLYGKPFSF